MYHVKFSHKVFLSLSFQEIYTLINVTNITPVQDTCLNIVSFTAIFFHFVTLFPCLLFNQSNNSSTSGNFIVEWNVDTIIIIIYRAINLQRPKLLLIYHVHACLSPNLLHLLLEVHSVHMTELKGVNIIIFRSWFYCHKRHNKSVFLTFSICSGNKDGCVTWNFMGGNLNKILEMIFSWLRAV